MARSPEIKPTLPSPRASEPKSVTTLPSSSHQPRAPISSAPNPILPKAPGLTDGFGSGLTSTARPSESKPPAPVAPEVSQTPSIAQPSSDALRRESERLQEQLASMLFAAEVPATPVKAVPVPPAATSKPPVSELPGKVVEMAKPQASVQSLVQPPAQILPPAPAANAKTTLPKSAPLPSQSPMDDEELKIPSWLEPLARNAATQAQNEPAAKEASANTRRVVEFEVQDVSAPPETQGEQAPTPAEQVFGTHFSEESDIEPQNGAKGNNKGVLIGAIAAGILVLVAVGVWHGRQSSAPAQQPPVTTAVTTAPAAAAPSAAQPTPATRNASGAPTPNRSNINSEPVAQTHNSSSQAKANSPSITPASDVTKISPDKNIAAELSAYKKLAEPPAPLKKPGLGEVHLGSTEGESHGSRFGSWKRRRRSHHESRRGGANGKCTRWRAGRRKSQSTGRSGCATAYRRRCKAGAFAFRASAYLPRAREDPAHPGAARRCLGGCDRAGFLDEGHFRTRAAASSGARLAAPVEISACHAGRQTGADALDGHRAIPPAVSFCFAGHHRAQFAAVDFRFRERSSTLRCATSFTRNPIFGCEGSNPLQFRACVVPLSYRANRPDHNARKSLDNGLL